LNITQGGVPAVIPAETCYLGWQESLTLLAKLVEAECCITLMSCSAVVPPLAPVQNHSLYLSRLYNAVREARFFL
jgi:hypothetical protein